MKEKGLRDYEHPSVTADIVVFSVKDNDLKVLLIKRALKPFENKWAIPGGFLRMHESPEDAAHRELREETGVDSCYLEQLYTFGAVGRDPRGRVISIAYFALINSDDVSLRATTDAKDVKWFSVGKLPKLSFDHKEILDYALKRLRWKFEYTTIAFSLLSGKFPLSNLRRIYETVFDKKFDKRNFSKKILSLGIVKETSEIQQGVAFRPAQLYGFTGKVGDIIKMI